MIWYFSRVLGLIGLLAAVVRVALAAIFAGESGDFLGAVGTGILFIVGGMLTGAIVDVIVRVRKRTRSREPVGARARRRR